MRDSYIGGRAVMRDRSLCRVDRKRIMEAAREAGERVLARYGPAGAPPAGELNRGAVHKPEDVLLAQTSSQL